MGKLNKTTAAIVAGAFINIVSVFFELSGDLQGSLSTVLTAAIVWLVPNVGGGGA